jgi:hypothetical protein
MFKYVFITLLLKRTILFKQLVAFELRLNMFVGIGIENRVFGNGKELCYRDGLVRLG